MKVRVTSRSGEDTHSSLEVPDDPVAFMDWLSAQGRLEVWPPGKRVRDFGAYRYDQDADPNLWTVHLIDEFD
jgi:hypothetical protein